MGGDPVHQPEWDDSCIDGLADRVVIRAFLTQSASWTRPANEQHAQVGKQAAVQAPRSPTTERSVTHNRGARMKGQLQDKVTIVTGGGTGSAKPFVASSGATAPRSSSMVYPMISSRTS